MDSHETHECGAPFCREQLQGEKYFCDEHWDMLNLNQRVNLNLGHWYQDQPCLSRALADAVNYLSMGDVL